MEEHTHPHEKTEAVLHRLARSIGHLEAVRRMVEQGRDCTEVLTQLAAVKSALNGIGSIVLQDHIEHCIADAVHNGNHKALEDLSLSVARFIG